ncbi:Endonuclease/Exonuclease/phosphatase family protein [Geodermatophilus pulveris]|uniref:Endonuclease/Exonuclease/phosphatase family protein n=1 Tax=Geodermatophilus pulveris TaxID=1564159 RepID=A0A239AZT1_9ACTN|nr:endonuclease/exonuclease/phosphatase family protein [Geodermatophilus pulveris]SNS01225.1 Endonuclease/Exonuclease/phosphatase family protein [Geodermatophilus pulveris]
MKKLVWVAAVVVVAATLLSGTTAAAARPTATYDVWHWNVAGSKLHGGSVTSGMVDAAAASIVNRGADLVAVNELCWQQYEALVDRLRRAGWPQDPGNFGRFVPQQRTSRSLCNGESLGVAVFSAARLGATHRWPLPSDGLPDRRHLLCVGQAAQPKVRFCTTHITTKGHASPWNGQPHNVNQLNTVLGRLEAYAAAGDTVLIAGDLNAQPHYRRLDNWYARSLDVPANRGNTGNYRELDDSDAARCPGYGEWTAAGPAGALPPCAPPGAGCTASTAAGCAKIDHVFVRQDRIAGRYWGDSLDTSRSCRGVPGRPDQYPPGSCSDHRILIGRVTVLTG